MWLRPHMWPTLYFCWTRMHRLLMRHCQQFASFPVPSMDTAPGQFGHSVGLRDIQYSLKIVSDYAKFPFLFSFPFELL